MKKLILRSTSPRRKELLAQLCYDFEVRSLPIDESFPEDLEPIKVAMHIAQKKSAAFEGKLQANEAVICADTVVIFRNEIFGKPRDREEAVQMLQRLSACEHQVVSAVVLRWTNAEGKTEIESGESVTEVEFHKLSDQQIDFYVDTFKPYDKAGAYGIQEWIGHVAVAKIEGSVTNVIGLPTDVTNELLASFFPQA